MGFFDLHEPEDGQDYFFLYAMIIVPFLSSGAYLFDAWYYYVTKPKVHTYEGLLSTIVIVFSYLQYCAPIRSRKARCIYHILLWIINEVATLGYLLYYIRAGYTFKIIVYVCFGLIELYFTAGLIYCRVICDLESHIIVENKHLFHFMSRLEVILTIFIPVYANVQYQSLTRNTIAYFLLFDFFSDSYARFQGIWIKAALYFFVATVTLSVATEWFYFNSSTYAYDQVSLIAELVSAVLCVTIILLQFFAFHFKSDHVKSIIRAAILYQQSLAKDVQNRLDLQSTLTIIQSNKISSTQNRDECDKLSEIEGENEYITVRMWHSKVSEEKSTF